jgi:hypothetical protein
MEAAHLLDLARWAEASQEDRWGAALLQRVEYDSWDLNEFIMIARRIQARMRVISWSLTLSTFRPLRDPRAGALSWRCQTRGKE